MQTPDSYDSRDLLTVEQAANHLHLPPFSIRLYIRTGRLKAFRIAGLRKVLSHIPVAGYPAGN